MKLDLRMMILTALFTALTAIGAFIKIPTSPPITLQFFFIALGAMLLGSLYGSLSQIVYLIIGLCGVPIFTQGGGLQYISYPTFGYLLGFAPAAFVIGYISDRVKGKVPYLFLCCMIGVLLDYAIGVPYLSYSAHLSLRAAFVGGFLVYLPGDILKCIIAALLAQKIIPQLKKLGYR
ncbi:MAG: biotin transporter BioY [Bacillota bacterium]|nr:biotin transporter BioY [Bacillota bacterium]